MEQLKIETYQINNVQTALPPSTVMEEMLVMHLSGPVIPGFSLTVVRITFIPDTTLLSTPVFSAPVLRCDRHIRDYSLIMDLITRGVNNQPGSPELRVHYDPGGPRVEFVLG